MIMKAFCIQFDVQAKAQSVLSVISVLYRRSVKRDIRRLSEPLEFIASMCDK